MNDLDNKPAYFTRKDFFSVSGVVTKIAQQSEPQDRYNSRPLRVAAVHAVGSVGFIELLSVTLA